MRCERARPAIWRLDRCRAALSRRYCPCAEASSVARERRLEARDVEAIFRAFAEVMREPPPDTEAGWLHAPGDPRPPPPRPGAGWRAASGDLRLGPDIGRKLRPGRGVRDVLRQIRQSHNERDS